MPLTDQRKQRRFELRLPIEVVRFGSQHVGQVFETRNVSSGGVLFASGRELPVGQPVEYRITLPTTANGVSLHCVGTVLRAESRPVKGPRDLPFAIAATLERYEFIRD